MAGDSARSAMSTSTRNARAGSCSKVRSTPVRIDFTTAESSDESAAPWTTATGAC